MARAAADRRGLLIWSINNFRGLEQAGESVVLVPWADFFFHARTIANFGHLHGDFGTLHWSMYGLPLPAYHYAGYMLSALVAGLSAILSIQLATSFYPVAGMLLSGASIFVLARASGGPRVGVLAVVLLFFLHDASNFVRGGGSRESSYFFFQTVGVGGAYAVAVLGLAPACALKAGREGSVLVGVWALCLLAISALFKAQIFLACGVFFVVFTIHAVLARRRPGLGIALIVASLAVYALAVSRLGGVPNAPTLSISLNGVRSYFDHGLGARVASAAQSLGVASEMPLAAASVLASAYGLLLVPLLVLMWRLRRDLAVRSTIGLALFCLATHLFVRLLVDDNRGFGDIGEINRKTFVWPSFVVVYCVAVLLGRFATTLPAAPAGTSRVSRPVAAGALFGLMVIVSAVSAYRVQKWSFVSESFSRVGVPQGLLASAAYLRTASTRGDVVQLCENDRYNELASLSERPVYVAKLMVNATPLTVDERERFAAIERIARQAQTVAAARATAHELRIGWFVLSPDCRPIWEGGAAPSFASDGYRVFDMRH